MAADPDSGSDRELSKNEGISSSFIKTVCLVDWWLIKTEKDFRGKRLAIGGITSKEKQAIREFSSSPIFKKYDAFTLETADGITVMVKSLINRDRTLQNGFPSEVCSQFLFGFPYNWEAYSSECFRRESTIPCVPLSSPVYVLGKCNEDVRNSGELSNAGNCNCEAINGEGPSVQISSVVKNISPPKVNVLVQLETSTNFPAVSTRKMRVSNDKGKHNRKFKDEEGLKGIGEAGTVNLVEEACGGNISGLAGCGHKETAEDSFVTTPNLMLPKISRKKVDSPVMAGLKMNLGSPSAVKQDKSLGRRVSELFKNLKTNQKENSGSTLCVTHEDNKHMLETFEYPSEEKLAGKSKTKKIPSGGKTDSNRIHCHSRTIQSSYDLRSLKSKLSKDQATGCSHETETDKVNPVSVDSVLVNDIRKDIFHKSKGKSALDLPDVELKEMKAEEVDSMYPLCRTQLDNMSSLSPKSVKKPESLSVKDRVSSETTNQIEDKEPDSVNEDFWSPITPSDVKKNTNYLKASVGAGERSAEEISTSGKKAKWKQVNNLNACSTQYRMKKSSIVSPESLSCKRSKSGRLIFPPLAFWENQQVVYDADGQITGIQNGLTMAESSAGSKSGTMKRKKKFI
ncbi:hypothetical protein NE237_007563 [Protea cynaroides]|uniref:SANTA domain-containing protein n=1 Tax=Protea cynaroides TaxID=273540 RepID=A0A9Q0KPR3_9MAGN|nr:hypothetical protein NE237_007563 [Protea cynaroides]